MADSEIKIKATLDLAEAKASLSTLGREVDASMSTAANGAQKLGKSLDQVATSAKLSAQQIGQIAIGFSGMGFRLAATVAEAQGYSKAAGYLSAIGMGAVHGAALGVGMGPVGIAAGAVVGGGTAGIGQYFNNEAKARAEEDARQKAVLGNADMIDQFDELRQAADDSAAFLKRMGDETVSTSERQAQLTGRMAEFSAAAEDLRAKLRTEEVLDDGAKFQKMMKEYARLMGEVSKMKGIDLTNADGAKGGGGIGALAGDYDSMQRLGITVAGGGGVAGTLASLSEKANQYLEQIERHLRADGIEPQARFA